jgi:energy-coupling factor transport system ATP-binding protein
MEIELTNVSFSYDLGDKSWALKDINLKISQGEKIAITGPAGSGKTTLLQLIDALILPTSGDIFFDKKSVKTLKKKKQLASIRKCIGLLFQFPEHQFFHENAYDEMVFGIKNLSNLDDRAIESKASDILDRFEMDIARLKKISPFSLSSGEKRKLALASTLLTSPEILMLDEPTAGLDARGRKELIGLISQLQDITVILVTHNLDELLSITDRIIGLSQGQQIFDFKKHDSLLHIQEMEEHQITPPLVLMVQKWLTDAGVHLDHLSWNMDDLISYLSEKLKAKENNLRNI